jgi:CRP-like cAMP-binding protein
VELAGRLQRLPLFDFTSVDELFRLARVGRQVRYEPGHVLYERGSVPASLQFVLDGQISAEGLSGRREISAPAALAFEEVLEGGLLDSTMTASSKVITLSMTPDEFLAVLSENVALSEGLFRQCITARGLATGHSIVRGGRSFAPTGELRAVDRLMVLQSNALLAHATAAQLWSLSQIARPVTQTTGGEILKADAEPALLFIVAGAAGVGGEQAGAGDVIGLHETLAGTRLGSAVTSTGPVTALKVDRQELFELLADHTDLLQGLFSKVVRQA